MSKKLVVDAEWLASLLEELDYCPPPFAGIPSEEPEPCEFDENGNARISCLGCWIEYGNGKIQPLTEAQERALEGWISVDDRLPETLDTGHYKKYLTCTSNGLVRGANWMFDGQWCLDMSGCSYFNPILWMPLPEAPKGGEKDE